MSTLTARTSWRKEGGGSLPILAALKARWAAYTARRLHQAAIAQLAAMTDRELKDIGLQRCDIAFAVTGRGGSRRSA